jgi:hypothetical protein
MKKISFKQLFDLVDEETQDAIKSLKSIPQSPKWHPEGDALTHLIIVFERSKKFNDVNLLLSAFFHDIGKLTTTFKNKKGHWAAHAHEKKSLKFIDLNKEIIEIFGADFKKVRDIVHHHMRIKQFDNMKSLKQERMRNFHCFNELVTFSEIDDMRNVTLKEINKAENIISQIF